MPIHERYLAVNFSSRNKPVTDYPSQLASFLLKTARAGSGRLLDIGSGRGDLAQALRALGVEVEIADINPEASQLAGSEFIFRQITKDGTIAVQNERYETVLLKSVIEHLHDPYPILGEIGRILQPNGKLIVMTPSWRHNVTVFYDAVGHVQPYTVRSLRLSLEIAGFSVDSCVEMRQVPWTWSAPGRTIVSILSPILRFIPRSIRRPEIRFLREATLLAVASRR